MYLRKPHTIPYSIYSLQYEEKDRKMAKIKEYIPLTPYITKYILGKYYIRDKSSAENDISDDFESTSDEIPDDIIRRTSSGRRHTELKLTEMLDIAAEGEEIDEAEKESEQYQKINFVGQPDEGAEEETEEEVEDETEEEIEQGIGEKKPFYDIEGRGRELKEQEERNEMFIQEFNDKANFLESKLNGLKNILDRDVVNFLRDIRRFEDEDLDDIKEDIEAILKEELSSEELNFEEVDSGSMELENAEN